MAEPKIFDPDYCFVRTSAEASLRVHGDYIVSYASELFERPEHLDEPQNARIASLKWRIIQFTLAQSRGEPLFDLMDADSSDMAHLYQWIMDPKTGEFRDETEADVWGNVLYVGTLDVEEGFDVHAVGQEMVEHVLTAFGEGSALATFMRGEGDALPFVRAIEGRGFKKLKGSGNVYCLSLARRRPPLPEASR